MLDLFVEIDHRHTGLDLVRDGAHGSVGDRAGVGHQLELPLALHPPQLVHEGRAVDELDAGRGLAELDQRLAPGPSADGDPLRASERSDCFAEEREPVVGFVDGHDLADLTALEVKGDVHARQHVDRVPIGRDQGAGDPAVRVVHVPEARQVALEPGEIFEIG